MGNKAGSEVNKDEVEEGTKDLDNILGFENHSKINFIDQVTCEERLAEKSDEAHKEQQKVCIKPGDANLDTCARKIVSVTQPDLNGLIKTGGCNESPADDSDEDVTHTVGNDVENLEEVNEFKIVESDTFCKTYEYSMMNSDETCVNKDPDKIESNRQDRSRS